VLHNQGGAELRVLEGIDLDVAPGECVVLDGPSGSGKSTLLKCLYATYRASAGSALLRGEGWSVDVTRASVQSILGLRKDVIGYVSQFLRVIPRVPALYLVAEPLTDEATEDPGTLEEARR